MKVRFLSDYNFRPPERGRRTTIAYKAGMEMTVRRCCGEEAVRAGKAVELEKAKRRPAS